MHVVLPTWVRPGADYSAGGPRCRAHFICDRIVHVVHVGHVVVMHVDVLMIRSKAGSPPAQTVETCSRTTIDNWIGS